MLCCLLLGLISAGSKGFVVFADLIRPSLLANRMDGTYVSLSGGLSGPARPFLYWPKHTCLFLSPCGGICQKEFDLDFVFDCEEMLH